MNIRGTTTTFILRYKAIIGDYRRFFRVSDKSPFDNHDLLTE